MAGLLLALVTRCGLMGNGQGGRTMSDPTWMPWGPQIPRKGKGMAGNITFPNSHRWWDFYHFIERVPQLKHSGQYDFWWGRKRTRCEKHKGLIASSSEMRKWPHLKLALKSLATKANKKEKRRRSLLDSIFQISGKGRYANLSAKPYFPLWN